MRDYPCSRRLHPPSVLSIASWIGITDKRVLLASASASALMLPVFGSFHVLYSIQLYEYYRVVRRDRGASARFLSMYQESLSQDLVLEKASSSS